MDWNPDFVDRSPMLEPLRELAAGFRRHADWPTRDELDALLHERNLRNAAQTPLKLVSPTARAEGYEQCIHARGEMQYREAMWHDFFNVLAWLVYPRAKAALNAAHQRECLSEMKCARSGRERLGRGRARDALTLFDESGAIVVCSDAELLEDVRALRWRQLFWVRRARVHTSMRVHVFGHGLMEKALQPYVGVTAHALLLKVPESFVAEPLDRLTEAVDVLAAGRIAALQTPRALSPLPLLGFPGWWADNERAAFYDNERYFRTTRSGAPGRRGAGS